MTINKIIKGMYLFLVLLTTVLFLNIDQMNQSLVKAADLPVTNAPKGLNFDDYFIRGTFRGNSADTSSFKNGDTSIIQITPKQGSTIGGVWSNDAANNYFDLNNKQTLSMWMYFGNEKDPADGLAFVLQNSGYDSISKDGVLPAKGQTMGVWGLDNDYHNSDPKKLSSNAIQNSWALEFDTHINKVTKGAELFSNGRPTDSPTGVNNAFDSLVTTIVDNPSKSFSHIASNYPASPESYVRKKETMQIVSGLPDSVDVYWYQLIHNNLKTTYGPNSNYNFTLSNGLWHHLVINWTPPETGSTIGYLSYSLDDKIHTADVTAGNNAQPVSTSDIPIDTSYFYKNTTQQFAQNAGKVIWGFTGSTGEQYARNMVIFESIPSLVEGSTNTQVFDDSQGGKELSSTDKNVYNYDQLRFVYNVKRDSGAQDWTNIVATINLPKNVLYGNGVIKYSDGTSETIGSNELTTTQFKRTLKDLLKDKDPNSATITLNAIAYSSTPAEDTAIAATDVSFIGDDLIKYTQLQDFVIKTTPMLLEPDNLNLDIDDAQSIDATGKISYIGLSGGVINSNITVHYSLNGSSEKTTNLDSGTDGKMKITIPRTSLKDGDNSLTVYATDKDGNRSNYVTYNISKPTAAPILIDADEKMSFQNVKSNGRDQTILRQGSWKVNIIDNAVDTSNWSLNASAIQTPGSPVLDGDLVYVDSDGITRSILDGSIIEIAKKDTFPSNQIVNDSTYQVANSWNTNNGILLKTKSTTKSGTYQYTITWSLTDSIH
ncbi:lectin-like domain-containing protein [Companilactobacillus baiquanensis]|uniref:Extracellular protein n=1 Tax=Companilactobacillus baiquanensis TaxID=2486005 RepID=A0ABW1UXR4_9LACO|nr:hypothetical protein [Companilactobacillus baiquanensis]